MKQLRINKQKIDWPTSWYDLTWGQVNRIVFSEQSNDDIYIMSVLTGLTPEFWRKYKDVEQYFRLVAEASVWMDDTTPLSEDSIKEKYTLNRVIQFNGQTYLMPADMGFVEVGLYKDAYGVIEKVAGKEKHTLRDLYSSYEQITKIMLHKLIHKEYDYAAAMEMNIDSVKWVQVAGFGSFFLKMLPVWRNGMRKTANRPLTMLKSRLRGMVQYLMNTVFLLRYGD